MKKLSKIPNKPGIYLFYNTKKELIYVGRATSLKNRVTSYFGSTKTPRPIENNVSQIKNIKWIVTDSLIEAIILEANYIKKYQPKYNVDGKDDKSWNYLLITKDKYPRLEVIRQHEVKKKIKGYIFGPFPGIKTKEMLKILQKIFNISTCQPNAKKPCFYYQMHQCLGVCTGEINSMDYKDKVIKPLIQFLRGNKKRLIGELAKKMKNESRKENFEEAGRLRNQIGKLKHIQDVSLLTKDFYEKDLKNRLKGIRIEGYDISNLGETGKVGSMVVFDENGPVKSEYRKFKIKTVEGQSDVACLKEIFYRRFLRKTGDWPKPDLILVDGGRPQVNVAKKIIPKIPIIGIAKGKSRKKDEFIGISSIQEKYLKEWIEKNKTLLIQARDEAHRFAINYQRKLRKLQI